MRSIIATLAVVLTVLVPSPVSYSDDKDQKERIAKLVKDLDDNDQKVRINATEELIKIGEPALEEVRKALAKPPNNEVKIRATHIVSEIEFNAKKFKIAFTSDRDGNFEIYVMDADGSNQKQLTNNNTNDWFSAWSPDGKKIAFMSKRDDNNEIYIMDVDGSNQKRLTNNNTSNYSPVWSPAGAGK